MPDFLEPFVVPVPAMEPERHGAVDLYVPDASGPVPAIVFVHGGPVRADRRPTPRDWPVYRGYGALVAGEGVVGVTVDHGLHSFDDYPVAAANIVSAVEFARADPRVDADRVALWYFSGGGPLLAERLTDASSWLRCVAATYPLLVLSDDDADAARFTPIDAVARAGTHAPPIVLSRVGLERPALAEAVESFVAAARGAGAPLEIVDVPNGRHGFDMLDHTDESRLAVREAVERVLRHLRR